MSPTLLCYMYVILDHSSSCYTMLYHCYNKSAQTASFLLQSMPPPQTADRSRPLAAAMHLLPRLSEQWCGSLRTLGQSLGFTGLGI